MVIDPIRPRMLTELAAIEHVPCISILMPTHHSGSETRQGPIRLSNLLGQVRDQLKSQGMRSPEIEGLLKPAREVIEQTEFWRFLGASLAGYLSDGMIRMLRMPDSVDESIMIGRHLDLKPLLGSSASSELFYVLALTKQQAKLYQATRSEFEEVGNDDFPLDAVEIVGIREGEAEIQHHSGLARRGSRGDRGTRSDAGQAGYHGHGEGETKIESDTVHYLKEVAERVADYLYGDDAPLILAADISLVGLYRREHSRGNLVVPDHIESPDALKPHEIHDQAWKIFDRLVVVAVKGQQ